MWRSKCINVFKKYMWGNGEVKSLCIGDHWRGLYALNQYFHVSLVSWVAESCLGFGTLLLRWHLWHMGGRVQQVKKRSLTLCSFPSNFRSSSLANSYRFAVEIKTFQNSPKINVFHWIYVSKSHRKMLTSHKIWQYWWIILKRIVIPQKLIMRSISPKYLTAMSK